MTITDLRKLQLLSGILEKMSPEEKQAFAMLNNKSNGNAGVMQALNRQSVQLADIQKRVGQHTWVSDFGANVAGNAVYGAAMWLLSRIIRGIR